MCKFLHIHIENVVVRVFSSSAVLDVLSTDTFVLGRDTLSQVYLCSSGTIELEKRDEVVVFKKKNYIFL